MLLNFHGRLKRHKRHKRSKKLKLHESLTRLKGL